MGYEAKINVDYSNLEALKYTLEKMNIKVLNIEYLENIEIIVDMQKKFIEQFTNNYNNNFNISKFDIVKEKFVEI